MSAGVPYGSGPEEAAADAEPTAEHRAVTPPPAAPAAAAGPPPAAEPGPGEAGQPFAIPGLPLDRPELHVGAAFAGGLLLALVLKRLAR